MALRNVEESVSKMNMSCENSDPEIKSKVSPRYTMMSTEFQAHNIDSMADIEDAKLCQRILADPLMFVEAFFNSQVDILLKRTRRDHERLTLSLLNIFLVEKKVDALMDHIVLAEVARHSRVSDLFLDRTAPSTAAMKIFLNSFGTPIVRKLLEPLVEATQSGKEFSFVIDSPSRSIKRRETNFNRCIGAVRDFVDSVFRDENVVIQSMIRAVSNLLLHLIEPASTPSYQECLGEMFRSIVQPSIEKIGASLFIGTLSDELKVSFLLSLQSFCKIMGNAISNKIMSTHSKWDSSIREAVEDLNKHVQNRIASFHIPIEEQNNSEDPIDHSRKRASLRRIRRHLLTLENCVGVMAELSHKSGWLEKCGKTISLSNAPRIVAVSPLHDRVFFYRSDVTDSWSSSVVLSDIDCIALGKSMQKGENYIELRNRESGMPLTYTKQKQEVHPLTETTRRASFEFRRDSIVLKSESSFARHDWVAALQYAQNKIIQLTPNQ